MGLILDRRRFLELGAVAFGSGLLVACSDGTVRVAEAGTSATPKSGGEIVYLNAFMNAGWARSQIGSWHALQIWGLFTEYLFYVDANNALVGHLATDYTHNDDFTTWNIKIREGVTFSNGEKLDAAAVVQNLDLVGLGDSSKGIARAANIPSSYIGASIVEDYEVQVSLASPFPAFIYQLAATSNASILAPATLALSLEEQSDLLNTFATGPWVPLSWTASKEVVLARREDYNWPRPDSAHDGPAYLEKITFQQTTENSLRVGALESGQAQVVHYTQPSAEERLKSSGSQILNYFASGSVWGLHIRLNAKHTDDIRVREALNRAIDRQEIIDTLYNSGWKVAQSPVNSSTAWAVDLSDRFGFDLDRANSLLDEAGWAEYDSDGYRVKNGETLEFVEYPSVYITLSRDALTLIAQQWKKAGIKLRLENVDYSNYSSATAVTSEVPVPLYEIHWSANYPVSLWRWWHSSQQNQFATPDPELDSVLDQITTATDDETAFALAKQALEFVIDNHYFIPVHEFPQNFSASSKLQGIANDGYPRIQLYDAWLSA